MEDPKLEIELALIQDIQADVPKQARGGLFSHALLSQNLWFSCSDILRSGLSK